MSESEHNQSNQESMSIGEVWEDFWPDRPWESLPRFDPHNIRWLLLEQRQFDRKLVRAIKKYLRNPHDNPVAVRLNLPPYPDSFCMESMLLGITTQSQPAPLQIPENILIAAAGEKPNRIIGKRKPSSLFGSGPMSQVFMRINSTMQLPVRKAMQSLQIVPIADRTGKPTALIYISPPPQA